MYGVDRSPLAIDANNVASNPAIELGFSILQPEGQRKPRTVT